jgi:hypothetical protein
MNFIHNRIQWNDSKGYVKNNVAKIKTKTGTISVKVGKNILYYTIMNVVDILNMTTKERIIRDKNDRDFKNAINFMNRHDIFEKLNYHCLYDGDKCIIIKKRNPN